MKKNTVLLGYSGHAYVVIDTLLSANHNVVSYFDVSENTSNPYSLKYLGQEDENTILKQKEQSFFVAIGDNEIRKNRLLYLDHLGVKITTAIHRQSIIGNHVEIGSGTLVAAGAIINSGAKIGKGCIINTGAIIEHECEIGNFTHVAPGAVIAGNVRVGNNSFIGANSVIRENLTIGHQVIIGAGSTIIKDVMSYKKLVGSPGRIINHQ